MPVACSGKPSATGASYIVVDSMQRLFGRYVGWCRLRISFEGLASVSEVLTSSDSCT